MDIEELYQTLIDLGFEKKDKNQKTFLKQGPLSCVCLREENNQIEFSFYNNLFAVYRPEELTYTKLMFELSKFFDDKEFNGMKTNLIRSEKIDTIIK